jgi:hypothetical protein
VKADLHLHTYFSDGTDSPTRMVDRAAELGFGLVAITDHDTMNGVAEALLAGDKRGVTVIPGVEITAQLQGQELHMLAYFPPDAGEQAAWRHPDLVRELARYTHNRHVRVEKIVARLNQLGIPLTLEAVVRQANAMLPPGVVNDPSHPVGALGRPHVGRALVEGGFVRSLDEAFDRFLKRGRAAWLDKERADAAFVIALIRRVGGLTSLAHPGLLRNDAMVAQVLREGVDALEAYHSRHTAPQSSRYRAMAQEHARLITGGSDCHGMLKGEPLLGRVELRDAELERFLQRLKSPVT